MTFREMKRTPRGVLDYLPLVINTYEERRAAQRALARRENYGPRSEGTDDDG